MLIVVVVVRTVYFQKANSLNIFGTNENKSNIIARPFFSQKFARPTGENSNKKCAHQSILYINADVWK